MDSLKETSSRVSQKSSNRNVGLCDLLPVAATEFVDKEALGRSEKLREVDGKGGSEMLAVW
jgi:hypothetical protein